MASLFFVCMCACGACVCGGCFCSKTRLAERREGAGILEVRRGITAATLARASRGVATLGAGRGASTGTSRSTLAVAAALGAVASRGAVVASWGAVTAVRAVRAVRALARRAVGIRVGSAEVEQRQVDGLLLALLLVTLLLGSGLLGKHKEVTLVLLDSDGVAPLALVLALSRTTGSRKRNLGTLLGLLLEIALVVSHSRLGAGRSLLLAILVGSALGLAAGVGVARSSIGGLGLVVAPVELAAAAALLEGTAALATSSALVSVELALLRPVVVLLLLGLCRSSSGSCRRILLLRVRILDLGGMVDLLDRHVFGLVSSEQGKGIRGHFFSQKRERVGRGKEEVGFWDKSSSIQCSAAFRVSELGFFGSFFLFSFGPNGKNRTERRGGKKELSV